MVISYYQRKEYFKARYQLKKVWNKNPLKISSHQGTVYFKSSSKMTELQDNSVDLIITSPPYWNIKDYSKIQGKVKINQKQSRERIIDLGITRKKEDVGNINNYQAFLRKLGKIWKECERVMKETSKLVIVLPFLNLKNNNSYSLCFDNWHWIKQNTNLNFYDLFVWNKKNRTVAGIVKGSFPYPGNIHSWIMMSEAILIFQKSKEQMKAKESTIEKKDWQEWRKPVWEISLDFQKEKQHSANFPSELPKRLISMYSAYGDTILDPFLGTGTVARTAQELGRKFIGYEIYPYYQEAIRKNLKLPILNSEIKSNNKISNRDY
jgi:modification methylase